MLARRRSHLARPKARARRLPSSASRRGSPAPLTIHSRPVPSTIVTAIGTRCSSRYHLLSRRSFVLVSCGSMEPRSSIAKRD